jgi:hypothetical protein
MVPAASDADAESYILSVEWRAGVVASCSIFSSPSSNRTFGFPEYGFPIIFFQRLSLSLGLPV